MVELNRLKATIELKKIDDYVAKKQKQKLQFTNEEVDDLELRQKALNDIIMNGKGEYNFADLPEVPEDQNVNQ